MSVKTQAFKYALKNTEDIMKQAHMEIKQIINNTAYGECDYFVISLELTPTGFKPRFEIESDDLDVLTYEPNFTAIFVDEGYKFLSWENLTKEDIIDFENTLTIKLEQTEKYDALADNLAEHN